MRVLAGRRIPHAAEAVPARADFDARPRQQTGPAARPEPSLLNPRYMAVDQRGNVREVNEATYEMIQSEADRARREGRQPEETAFRQTNRKIEI